MIELLVSLLGGSGAAGGLALILYRCYKRSSFNVNSSCNDGNNTNCKCASVKTNIKNEDIVKDDNGENEKEDKQEED
jgi:hypothetical protein